MRLAPGIVWAGAVAALLAALPAHAQPRPPGGSAQGWPAVEIGARAGFDNQQRQEVLGALLRIPVLRNGHVELLPNADVTFLRGLKEYQLNLEAAYLLAGREGGPYLGGGVGFRNTIPPNDPTAERQTLTTFGLVVGIKFGGLGRVRPFLEFRRVFASDLAVDPQLLSFGVTFALW